MTRTISQRELRNQSGQIMRDLDEGHAFVVTRNGTPVGRLTPVGPRQFVSSAAVLHTFAGSAPLDAARFRADVDEHLDQDPAPRG